MATASAPLAPKKMSATRKIRSHLLFAVLCNYSCVFYKDKHFASARPRSLPYGGEGNFARIRPKESASAEIVLRTPVASVSGAQYKRSRKRGNKVAGANGER